MDRAPYPVSPEGQLSGRRPSHRLLIPIEANGTFRRSINFAIDLARQSDALEACLLHIVEPVRSWEILRLKTEEDANAQAISRSELFLEAAASHLRTAGIPCKTYFRETEPIFGILDLAEQLDCTGIVVPKPDWLANITNRFARSLKNAQRSIPVIVVRADGSIAP